MSDFLGTGWAFPPRLDRRGHIALAAGHDDIEEAIRIILRTPIGQRVMRPTFGSRLHELVFAEAMPAGVELGPDESRSYAEWLRPGPAAKWARAPEACPPGRRGSPG